jgi:hypothetical protein
MHTGATGASAPNSSLCVCGIGQGHGPDLNLSVYDMKLGPRPVRACLTQASFYFVHPPVAWDPVLRASINLPMCPQNVEWGKGVWWAPAQDH